MIKVSINSVKANKFLSKVTRNLDKLTKDAGDYFRSKTPEKSGNARRKTSTRGNTIRADYPYAERLDKGWSSKAREGMTKPTITFIEKWLVKLMRK